MTHDDDVIDERPIRFEDLFEPFELPAGDLGANLTLPARGFFKDIDGD